MIPIDTRKLELPRTVSIEHCKDESVRIIRYTKSEAPKDLLTMQKRPSYYGDSTEYTVSVHLPEARKVEVLATVAHTSVNCWKMTVSTDCSSDILTYKTLNEVTAALKRLFA